MLTRENLQGVWVPLLVPWSRNGELDAGVLRRNLARYLESGINGVYTTGSTGEFYALDEREFARLVEIGAECLRGTSLGFQVGITWVDTRGVLWRAKVASSVGADGVQVAFPFWMRLNKQEVLRFFDRLAEAYPDLPIIHYNIGRSGVVLSASDYAELASRFPTLIGTKLTGGDWGALSRILMEVPELAHFVGEGVLLPAMMLGAKGTYSSLANLNPFYIVKLYRLCAEGKWGDALPLHTRINEFFCRVVFPLVEEGHLDPVIDKALAAAAGWLEETGCTREPYLPLSEDQIADLRRSIRERYPEFAGPSI